MTEIGVFDFSLINHNVGYMQFNLRYSLQDAFWEVSGIGWLSEGNTKYYLSGVFRNGELTKSDDLSNAGIMLQDYSMKFECGGLDALVKSQIQLHWKNSRKKSRKKIMIKPFY
jgi:hypothetical protein